MLGLFRRHLVAKLAVLLLVMVSVGFSVSAAWSIRAQSAAMNQANGQSALALGRSLTSGIRNSMLAGNGLAVRRIIHDMQSTLQGVQVRIFAPDGAEVFAPIGPPPPQGDLPEHVRLALGGKSTTTDSGAHAVPLTNDERCRKCHAEGNTRGVLTIQPRSPFPIEALATITREAFIQIMTAEKEDDLDEFLADLSSRSPGVDGVLIVDTDGNPRYGDDDLDIDDALFDQAMAARAPFKARTDRDWLVEPLLNEPRCHGCHDKDAKVRGAMFIAVAPTAIAPATIEAATIVALEHVMLCGLGRLVDRFLSSAADSGAIATLTLHDPDGRTFFDRARHMAPPREVAEALSTGRDITRIIDTPTRADHVQVFRLENEVACQRCHGSDAPIRGAISIAIDTTAQRAERRSSGRLSVVFAAATIAFVMLGLYLGLRLTVLNPVAAIGRVADRVGTGRLDQRAPVPSPDEIGRLAERLNEMIVGLEKKLELSKFVSRETVRTIDALDGAVCRQGTRQHLTVLFSDIRGFTKFSETRAPEEVVEMLNQYLHAQAEVVTRFGGDIDKFVGDELMARFSGADQQNRATRCAVEMIAAVNILNEAGDGAYGVSIGVGVNSGDMVLGAMGAEQRMDFTVIGDAVNLGARLCSAASGGQVLISEAVQAELTDATGLVVGELDPITVKGKSDPIRIYSVFADS